MKVTARHFFAVAQKLFVSLKISARREHFIYEPRDGICGDKTLNVAQGGHCGTSVLGMTEPIRTYNRSVEWICGSEPHASPRPRRNQVCKQRKTVCGSGR